MKTNIPLALAALSALLPGDHIHHRSPLSYQSQTTAERLAAIDAAERKRNRKNAKRRANRG